MNLPAAGTQTVIAYEGHTPSDSAKSCPVGYEPAGGWYRHGDFWKRPVILTGRSWRESDMDRGIAL